MQYHLERFRAGSPDHHPAAVPWRPADGSLPTEVDVLIAGCGPAGLCLAAQLARFPSIRTMIVEPKPGPIEKGQADGISVRSMEMFQAFGFAEAVMRESVWINETTFWAPDAADVSRLRRTGRVQDVADGLSEMPHVLLNQARVHDYFLALMRQSPSRLEPDYGLRVASLQVDPNAAEYPVTVTLHSADAESKDAPATVRARFVVGCDGARSNVRQAIGGALHGDSAHQAWGVMDVLVVTDFPDIRMKSIVRSATAGSLLVLPREGGYLVRLYVELDNLDESERVADRGLGIEDVIAKAQRILAPFRFAVREVVWWSIYEIGHRLSDTFDDVPAGSAASRTPRVLLAGDACHTHSPKAGQGMNVSMGDTFNLGWKLAAVLQGRAAPALLHTYNAERGAVARSLVEFDHRWSRVVGGAVETEASSVPRVQQEFVANGEFTAGLTVRYEPSVLTGPAHWQDLAAGFPIGKRFHSAPVIRLADARPMHLGHVVEADGRWRLFLFAGAGDVGEAGGALAAVCRFLEDSPQSPLRRHTREGEAIDAVIDVRAVFQAGFRDMEHAALPALLRPCKGRLGLHDYEKAFCAQAVPATDVFAMRGIDRERGCIVVVRPDQYVAHVLPLAQVALLGEFFAGFLT